ncbi:MAG: carboxypeptidase regulatory-like domain-containing protein [Planctomycetota bacterium]|nr:carboxypeptidase regulatory-like domain-containing protein [Planctomycetota bacterium]
MDCRDVDGRLHAYLEREVPSREDGLIRGHLSLCTRCRDHATAIDKTTLSIFPVVPEATAQQIEIEILRELRGGRRLASRSGGIALAILITVAAVVGYLVFGGEGPSAPHARIVHVAPPGTGPGTVEPVPHEDGTLPDGNTVGMPGIAIRGRITDTNGQAVEGVRIQVSMLDGDIAPEEWNAVTGPNGTFRIANVHGEILLDLAKSGYVGLDHALPQITSWIEEGRTTHDLELKIAAAGEVTGTVLDEAGTPLSGVRVQGRREEGQAWSFRRTVPRGEVEVLSDLNGSYRLSSVPRKGSVRVLWIHRDYALVWTDPFEIESLGGPVVRDIVLAPGGSVEGRVTDDRGSPRPGADIRVFSASDGEPHPIWDRTGSDGSFRVDFLSFGEWELRVGFGTAVRWKGKFQVTPERRTPEVEVRLERERATAASRYGVVLGRALPLEGGEGLKGVEVRAIGDDFERMVRAGPTGGFRVQGSAGVWTVEVSAPERSIVTWEGLQVMAGEETNLGDIFLPPEALIWGRIVDGEGAAVPGAKIQILDSSAREVTARIKGRWTRGEQSRADADGNFKFGGLGQGEYWIVVTHPELPPAASSITATEAADSIAIILNAAPEVILQFEGADGAPVVPSSVLILVPGGPTLMEFSPSTASVGVVLGPGQYTALIIGPGGAEIRQDLTIPDEAAEPIAIRAP